MGSEPTEADRTAARVDAIARLDPSYPRYLKTWDFRTSPNIDAMFNEPDPLPAAFEQALRFTGFAFDTYKAKAAADGAKLVVLASHEVKGAVDSRLRNLLKERDISMISQGDYIARQHGNPASAHWPHDGHWSPQGHTWAAEALVEYMETSGVCSGP
jgi:hypothetical protein